MRSLHIPQISTREVRAESDFWDHMMIRRALREREPSYTYLWLRNVDENAGLDFEDTCIMYRERERDFYRQMAMADLWSLHELFSWGEGLFPVDVVWTSRVGVAPLLSLGLGMMGGQVPMPVVLTEPRVYGPHEARAHNIQSRIQSAIRAAGYATCYGLYMSDHEKQMALASAEEICTPAVLRGWDERAVVVDAPVTTQVDADHPRPDRPKRLLYAGRLNANKRWRDILKSFGKVMMSRDDVEVWVHAGTGAYDRMDSADHRWHRTSERLPSDKYHELMSTAHVGLYLSHDEGANVTSQELIASGVAMLLPDAPWVERLFAPHRYPFLVDTETSIPSMLDWMLDNYDECHRRLAPIREFIGKERSWEKFQARLGILLGYLSEHPRPEPYQVFRKALPDMIRPDVEGIGFTTAMRIGAAVRGGVDVNVRTKIACAYACYRAVRDLDDMHHADPFLRLRDPKEEVRLAEVEAAEPVGEPLPEIGGTEEEFMEYLEQGGEVTHGDD